MPRCSAAPELLTYLPRSRLCSIRACCIINIARERALGALALGTALGTASSAQTGLRLGLWGPGGPWGEGPQEGSGWGDSTRDRFGKGMIP